MDARRLYLESIYVILVFFALQVLVSGDMFEDDDDESGSWNRCPWIRNKLKNGRVKIRSRGRIAKFLCEPGYELAGKRFATCVRGQWNNPIPVCVSRGCYRPTPVDNGRVTLMYRGAVLMYDCLPGYTLDGSSSIYCDGRKWSSVPPSCVVSTSDPQTSCDFEDPDLCGWSQDPTHEFDWKRNQFATPSGHAGTGPSYDHSFGEGKGGFYLFMEASAPRVVNDTARLFSPVYPSEYSGGCFIFWYHMFGSTTGGLRVFVKPESQVFGELPAAWVTFGDQGNRWHRGNVTVPYFSERFQIIIEGIRGTSYLGDTAIDDVNLFTVDCESVGNSTDNTSISEIVSDSCRGRCRESDNSTVCGCNDDCVWSNSCCDDFGSICTKSSETEDENKEEQAVDLTTSPTTTRDAVEIETTYITGSKAFFTSDSSVSTSNLEPTTAPAIPITTAENEDAGTLFTVAMNTTMISSSTTSSSTTSLKTTVETTSRMTSATSSTPPNTPLATYTTPSTTTSTTPSTTQSTITSIKPLTTTSTTPSTTTSTTQSTTTTTPSTTTSTTPSTTTTANPPTTSLPTTTSAATKRTPFSSTTSPIMVYSSPITSTVTSLSLSSTLTTLVIPAVVKSTSSSVSEIPAVVTELPSPETQSTRRTYNLRPRTRSSPMISPPTTRISLPNYSTSQKPPVITSNKPFDKDTSSNTSYPVKPHTSASPVVIQRPTVTSTEAQMWFRPRTSTPSVIRTTTRPLSTARETLGPTSTSQKTTRRLTSEERARTTVKSVSEMEAHASKTSSTVSGDGQPAVTVVSIIIVMLICITAGSVYFIRRRKAKALSKLGDDSEMRFLSENEVMEYSDSSAIDRNVFNP